MRIPRRGPATLAGLSILLLATAIGRAADDPPPPAASYQQLSKEFQDAQEAFSTLYRGARDDAERQKVIDEKYPRPDQYAPRFLAFAEAHPDDPAAVEALTRVIMYSRSGDAFNKALDLLSGRYVGSEKLGAVCQQLAYTGDPHVEAALRTIREKSPHRPVQGQASYALGQYHMFRNQPQEAEKHFEQVIERYADVDSPRGTLGEAAKAQLHEIRDLAIGKVAPDIEGRDVDGKQFKLSDYRGKVVVLDFWGDW